MNETEMKRLLKQHGNIEEEALRNIPLDSITYYDDKEDAARYVFQNILGLTYGPYIDDDAVLEDIHEDDSINLNVVILPDERVIMYETR